MDTKAQISPVSSNHIEYAPLAPQAQRATPSKKEYLPFTIRLVQSDEQLSKALQIRYSAYARHVPTFAETLKMAEPLDNTDGVAILLAESKLDGSPLGTMRIQTNWFNPLTLEQSIELPEWLKNRSLAEATRLGVTEQSIGRNVKTALFKAYFQFCVQNGIEWMVIAGRSPIDRQYDRLLFSDVYPGMGYIPLQHANNMPHRVLSFEVGTAEERWNQAKHPLTNFVFHTDHPDIDVGKRNSHLLQ
ncbi:hypothetical protein [Paucimonas lemoignei]|nr:hypothetical protein [Paucimonas lemoignei]